MTGVLVRRGECHVKTETHGELHATTEAAMGVMQL